MNWWEYELISIFLVILFLLFLKPLWQIKALLRYERQRKRKSK